ncbi:hypothetical protein [Pseudomonas aeruginosa]|uniref:hypothetical protein n=1 Tax=Pseudomonas aeruginosa TaxID=287 RepID=UPI001E2E4A62|nr:hypothetical protein [Pseudomonas aeruginosa]MCC9290078.1 hypothetical protein [Pseudomonas aeruginosa]UVN19080.1 hypothetical protein [Pseudomonas aeruginosa]
MANKRKTPAQLQAQCEAWNKLHGIATQIAYEEVRREGESHRGRTTTEAQVLGGHSAVIWLERKSGSVSLEHCMALAT